MAASAFRTSLIKIPTFYKLNRCFQHACVNLNKHDMSRRCYSRAFRRNPIKIIMPGEENNHEENDSFSFKKSELDYIRRKPAPQPLNNNNFQSKNSRDDEEDSTNVIPHFIKLGNNAGVFTEAITLAKSKKKREKSGKMILEGKRLIKDALQAGVKVDAIFFSLEENISGLPLESILNLKLYKVMYKDLQLWSDLTTCPGIIGIFKIPDYEKFELPKSEIKLPLTVILDEIREPNNLGAILRCVAASGCSKLLLTKGCVDIWEPKVLRSAAGAHFHIKVINNIEWSFMNNYTSADANVILADNHIVPEELKEYDPAQALNDRKFEEERWFEVSEDGKLYKPSYDDKNKLKKYRGYQFPTVPFHKMKIDPTKETILVIGGETHGLSDAGHQFAATRKANRLIIELANNVESLNSSVAAGIIIFEILRQMKSE